MPRASTKRKRSVKTKSTKIIMKAIENLTQSVSALTTAVDGVVAVLSNPPVTNDTDIQAAADAVTAQTARLTAAVTPPAPTA
jgi:hypothetical protein